MVEILSSAHRPTWLALRLRDLTMSDVPAVIGVDPHRSPLRVYAEKTGMIIGGGETPIMRRGRWFEAAAVEALREEFPDWDIRRPKVYLRDPAIRLGATPDCIAEDPADPGLVNVQVKVVSRPIYERDWPEPNGAPLGYRLQALGEGMLLDAKRSILAALVVDTFSATLELRDVPRHPAAEARIREVAVQFWRNIEAGVRPTPDYEHDAETIAEMFPHADKGTVLDLSADNRMPDLLEMREDVRTAIDNNKARLDGIDAEIKMKLGAAEAAELPGWKLSWRNQTRKSYTVAESSFRVLRVTRLDEEQAA